MYTSLLPAWWFSLPPPFQIWLTDLWLPSTSLLGHLLPLISYPCVSMSRSLYANVWRRVPFFMLPLYWEFSSRCTTATHYFLARGSVRLFSKKLNENAENIYLSKVISSPSQALVHEISSLRGECVQCSALAPLSWHYYYCSPHVRLHNPKKESKRERILFFGCRNFMAAAPCSFLLAHSLGILYS